MTRKQNNEAIAKEREHAKHPGAVALGRLGGSVKSRAKALAVARNGRLGGRPKKQPAKNKSK